MSQPAIAFLFFLLTSLAGMAQPKNELDGAWRATDAAGTTTILSIGDNYLMQTTFVPDRFMETRGGPWTRTGTTLLLTVEFDTQDSSRVGQVETYALNLTNGKMTLNGTGTKLLASRLDAPIPQPPLTGLWRITGRVNEGGVLTKMQAGPRKTIKLLTGNRFQWAAINPQTKQFMGTGGGTYRMDGDQYTETIDFFSRDNSRVGRSLTFTAIVNGSDWQHSGKSSTGGAVNEVWSREK